MGHITEKQRYTISSMLESGYSQKAIAKVIGKDKSVISRELSRNSDKRNNEYSVDLAQRKYFKRQKEKPKNIKFTQAVQDNVEKLLLEDYSPEQIVGTLKKEGKATVSIERIYQHIWKDKASKGELHLHLRRQGRKYSKRGSLKKSRGIIKDRVAIDKRPKEVDLKERFGDLEVDLIIGKNHKQAIIIRY
jgi:IS30 family transposase